MTFETDVEDMGQLLKDVIYELEDVGIHVLITVCDQAGRNVHIQNELGITTEQPTFKNPHPNAIVPDVIFTYDSFILSYLIMFMELVHPYTLFSVSL